jgi:hypothetical protein
MPRRKMKFVVPAPAIPLTVQISTPAFPNVYQAARHFGFKNPDTSGAKVFRRWAHQIGASVVKSGRGYSYNLKQLEELWLKQAAIAA